MEFPKEWTKTYPTTQESAQTVAYALAEFLDRKKDMITETKRTRDGYTIECKGDVSAEWTKYLGMDAALAVDLSQDAGEITVSVRPERWMEKAGIAAVGAFVLHPLMVTAGIGAVRVAALIQDIFSFISDYLEVDPIEEEVVERVMMETVTCPHCHTENKIGAIYCKNCGKDLIIQEKRCPECGELLEGDEKFCTACGADLSHPEEM